MASGYASHIKQQYFLDTFPACPIHAQFRVSSPGPRSGIIGAILATYPQIPQDLTTAPQDPLYNTPLASALAPRGAMAFNQNSGAGGANGGEGSILTYGGPHAKTDGRGVFVGTVGQCRVAQAILSCRKSRERNLADKTTRPRYLESLGAADAEKPAALIPATWNRGHIVRPWTTRFKRPIEGKTGVGALSCILGSLSETFGSEGDGRPNRFLAYLAGEVEVDTPWVGSGGRHWCHSKQGNHDESESTTKSFLHNASLHPSPHFAGQRSATCPPWHLHGGG